MNVPTLTRLLAFATLASTALGADGFEIQLDVVSSGFDKETCWVHPRAGILPASTLANPEALPVIVLTMNKLRLTGSTSRRPNRRAKRAVARALTSSFEVKASRRPIPRRSRS